MTRWLGIVGLLAGLAGTAFAAEWRPDEWITTKTSIALYAIPEVDPAGITVENDHGHVTVIGSVPSAEAKRKVVEVVRQVEGVTDVKDNLEVAAEPLPVPPRVRSTEELRSDIVEKMRADEELRSDNEISVRAEAGGVVVLGGFASSLSDQLRALRVARGVDGVSMVRNEMKSPPETLHDPLPAEGAAQGADARNRRERQARERRAVEPIPAPAGDAPAGYQPDPEHPAATDPESDTSHSPYGAE